ncbi:peptidase C39 family protein [Dongia soli]|uniref:Peptidase C39 family protein n=1 Tax=Dongia soli TaxID=600628 RepID=A0ABU5E787_9PROT|nr:peptidase C39 family protein [Dongia soli]MDY0881721.1 peptidase C39 family protein [Dongia soli]
MPARGKAAAKPRAAKKATRKSSGRKAGAAAKPRRIAYYNQSTGFTCGPSSLMMAMNALDPKVKIARRLELQLWREATTIFMGAGHGGSGALGLALAAKRRGFSAEVWMNKGGVFLSDRLDDKDRIQVMRLLQQADLEEAKRLRIPVHRGNPSIAELRQAMAAGAIPIVLVSTNLFHGDDTPHWVVVSAIEDEEIRVNDPWISRELGQTARQQAGRTVSHADFKRMTVYGPKKERSTVLIRRG